MHPTQQNVLESLQQGNSRKFGELLQEVAETSDNLTYHLKQLQKSGFIEALSKGEYSLARKGLIYLNNNLELNHDLFPTVSCMLELYDSNDRVLLMRKLKQPYLGSTHLPTFGIISSRTLHDQIEAFLSRYRITAEGLAFRGLHRERTKGKDNLLVFDKFFAIFRGNFTSFERTIDDREFTAVSPAELTKSTQLLPASKTVLSLGPNLEFTENAQD